MFDDPRAAWIIGPLLGGLVSQLFTERTLGRRVQRIETLLKVIAGHLKIETD